ncbi:hypothetical protein ISF6_1835 [Piscinibacter sakaiensis]|uniref:DUF1653 domain-containing protein n=1 Tax=Piscinibacter sakaiensis TaxID=1547922 RepID=A0A0K8P1E7_PISS1|nr:hypothetical protein ISF6_1835 [Piscinibacter sakaiensis]
MPAPTDPPPGRVAASPAAAAVSLAGSDLPPLPALRPGRYRHHKGGRYRVLGVVRHSETLEPMALYRPLDAAVGDWVRPYAMFVETVEVDGRVLPRFRCEEPPDGCEAQPVDAPGGCAGASVDPGGSTGIADPPGAGPAGSGGPLTEDLQATVARMEARLGADPRPAVAAAWMHYRALCPRFEADLAASPRDALLARASALMLLQAIASGG